MGITTQSCRIKLPRPHKTQREVLEHPAQYKVLNCGRQWGKTEALVHMALMGNCPGGMGALGGHPIMYTSLTYKNVKEFWGRLTLALPEQVIEYKNESDKFVKLVTGGSVECWAYDRIENSKGRNYAGILADEAAITPKLEQAVNEVYFPMLLVRDGWLVLGSTPRGYNYFHELFLRGCDENSLWKSFHFTTYDNPKIPTTRIDAMQNDMPDQRWQQEILAQFTALEGSIFDLDAIIYIEPRAYIKGNRYVAGVDWGMTDDYTVLCIIDATTGEEVYIERWRQIHPDTMYDNIVSACIEWGVEKIQPELNSIGWVGAQLLTSKIEEKGANISVAGFQTTNDSKRRMVDNLAHALRNGYLNLQDVEYANNELSTFVQSQTPNGQYKYDHLPGAKSDTVIARMAAWDAACNLIW